MSLQTELLMGKGCLCILALGQTWHTENCLLLESAITGICFILGKGKWPSLQCHVSTDTEQARAGVLFVIGKEILECKTVEEDLLIEGT